MTHAALPEGAVPKGSSKEFDERSIPAPLLEEHSLSPGRWGVLKVVEGAVGFVDLSTGEDCLVEAPGSVTIAPNSPHKLRLQGAFRARIEFYVCKS